MESRYICLSCGHLASYHKPNSCWGNCKCRTVCVELSGREFEVLKRLARGVTVKAIATEFNLSPKTVQTHTYNLMRKCDVHTRAELLALALVRGIITLKDLPDPPGIGIAIPPEAAILSTC